MPADTVVSVEAVLFSGHMVDAPGRAEPRFPPEHVERARRDIAEAVWLVDGDEAVAVSGLACGGDLLFAEEWLRTGRPLRAFLPRPVEDFLDESVRFAGEDWVASFQAVSTDSRVTVTGPDPEMLGLEDPHSPNNLRMLAAAVDLGDSLQGIFLWDGKGGDGPGGTKHLAEAVIEAGGGLTILRP